MQQTAKAEGELTQALGRLFALTEAYPDLKATGNVAQLQEELTSTENKIGFARQLYNDVATQYNTKQMQFPTNLVAGLAKASPAELWEIEDAGERAVPVVDLSLEQTGVVSDDANLFAQQEANRRRSHLADHRLHALLRLGRLRRRPRVLAADRRRRLRLLPSRRSLHRHRQLPSRRRHLLVLLALRPQNGCSGPPAPGS